MDGEVVALDLHSKTYLAINQTGAVLWPELVQGTTEEQLVQKLEDAFGVSAEQARADISAFVGQLRARNLLEQL